MCTMRALKIEHQKSNFFFFSFSLFIVKQLKGIELTNLLHNIWKLYPIDKLDPEFYKNYTAVLWFLNKTIDRIIVTQDIK